MLFSLLTRFLVSIIATMGFAVLFNLPKSELIYAGVTGGIGYLVYMVLTEIAGLSMVFSNVVASLILIIIGRKMAVYRKCPVVAYLLVTIFPLVPGLGIYYTTYYMINGPYPSALAKGLETLECAAAIAFGIAIGTSIPQKWFTENVTMRTKLRE